MTYTSLRTFLDVLEQRGLLIRVKDQVSSVLEMTEIQKRLIANGGPAVIFENAVTENGKSEMPVLINLFGTTERVALGMNTEPSKLRELGELLAFLRQPEPPGGWREMASMFPLFKKIMAMKPKLVSNAPCQEVIWTGEEVNLAKIPIQTCWPGEPAPLITWPIVITKATSNNDVKDYNLGIYRMQVVAKNQTLMRWLKHRGGAEHHRKWSKEHKDSFPVAVAIGADPATILAAVTPIPDNLSEYQFSGLLRGSRLELVDCKTIPLKVPAQAEIILEGHVSLNEYLDEGPYGDHTGYYNDVEKFPIFTISAITMRKKPIYMTTYTGRPPDEPSVLGEALNELMVPLLIQQFPEVVDFWLPPEGCSYRVAVVSIRKSYPGHAKRIMMGIWGFLRQFMYTKFVIVVDEDINCRDWKDVIWAISTRMDPARDITLVNNSPIDYLDFASPESELGSKIGFDATNKIYPETHRNWGKAIVMSEEIVSKVTANWKAYGLPDWNK
jgi:4-hydroxy-3-polyprenylbenzoate decarboxylase